LRPPTTKPAAVLLALVLVPLAARAVTVRLGVGLGARTVNDAKVKNAYGSGFVQLPYLQVSIRPHLFLGLAYEGGYKKEGRLGVYNDAAVLTLRGLDLTLGTELRAKWAAAYLQAGYGLYEYRQKVPTTPFSSAHPVNRRQSTVVAAVGIRLYPEKFFYLTAEAKYVPLKVRPYDSAVDLGGWRFLGGLGFSLNL
jgi:hypothetical protein